MRAGSFTQNKQQFKMPYICSWKPFQLLPVSLLYLSGMFTLLISIALVYFHEILYRLIIRLKKKKPRKCAHMREKCLLWISQRIHEVGKSICRQLRGDCLSWMSLKESTVQAAAACLSCNHVKCHPPLSLISSNRSSNPKRLEFK